MHGVALDQAGQHGVHRAAVRGRRMGRDVFPDQRVWLLLLGAEMDPELVLGVMGVGTGTGSQVGDQLVARPDAGHSTRRPLAECHRETREVAVLDHLGAAAE